MIFILGHRLILALYAILPPLAVVYIVLRARRKKLPSPWWSIVLMGITCIIIGAAACLVYGVSLGGMVTFWQMALTCYLVAGLLCIIKLWDRAVDRTALAIFRVDRAQRGPDGRWLCAMAMRVVLLFGIGLPYIIAVSMTFHPKISVDRDTRWLQLGAQDVRFTSMDGLNLAGLWVPAGATPRGNKNHSWGKDTVIICSGMGAGKTAYLALASELVSSGYNVLSFDFRGFGESDGNLISFGDRERFDVLGAVRWLKTNRPRYAKRIDGVGIDTGGAALLAAAADPSPEAKDLNSLVVSGCYDRFTTLADTVTHDYFLPPLRWVTVNIGVPLASVQTGCDLVHFSPADDAAADAPRAILFIHGKRDRIVRFELGESLFDQACAPKVNLWLDGAEDNAMNAAGVDIEARKFLDVAVPMI